jgi:hypothetical protein
MVVVKTIQTEIHSTVTCISDLKIGIGEITASFMCMGLDIAMESGVCNVFDHGCAFN